MIASGSMKGRYVTKRLIRDTTDAVSSDDGKYAVKFEETLSVCAWNNRRVRGKEWYVRRNIKCAK